MTLEAVTGLLQVGLPTGLIIIGVWFVIKELWPWWEARDKEERARRHERELRRGDSSAAMASHLSVIAHSMTHVIEYCLDRSNDKAA